MSRCPITYRECGEAEYSPEGLRLLNSRLHRLRPLPMSASEQRREAIRLAGKLSIQGLQPKLSARLSVKRAVFEPVSRNGHYILKPQHADYPRLPENEALTMHMARTAGLEVPVSGLLYSADGSMTYFVRRFDRVGRAGKRATEDFAQLAGKGRDTKYGYSMEQLAGLVDGYCTFPAVERARLFRRTLFCWLTGNEDMHLKNFSVIGREGKVELSPLYDCLSTTVALMALGRSADEIEEMALPLHGKKRHLTRRDLVEYYGRSRLGLPQKVTQKALAALSDAIPQWLRLVDFSFLDEGLKSRYRDLLARRRDVLGV